MRPDLSVRLAAAAVASVLLLVSCRPVLEVKPVESEPPAPEYEVQYSYLNPDGSESLVPTDIRVYSTTKDGVRQPGYALVQLAKPGVYSIMFTDDVSDPKADFLQLFFISGAGLPLRIVNRFTVVGEDGLVCDGLSTALFVMGTDASLELYENHGGFEAVLVSGDGIVQTEGARTELVKP